MALHLVTGGAGFIGSHLTHGLVLRGDRVRVLDDLSSGRRENLGGLEVGEPGSGAQVELMVGSITDLSTCGAAMEGVHGVFHEAAQVSVPESVSDPVKSYSVNVFGTQSLLEAARKEGVKRFVFAASSAAYGESEEVPKVESMAPRPCSPYASSKVAAEHLLDVYASCFGMETVPLRYFNVFGPRQVDDSPYTGVIAIFAVHCSRVEHPPSSVTASRRGTSPTWRTSCGRTWRRWIATSLGPVLPSTWGAGSGSA